MNRRRLFAGAVVAALAAGGLLLMAGHATAGGFCARPATEGPGTTVEMRKDCFSPTILRAPAWETVTFVNRDSENHTVTGVGKWAIAFRHHEIAPGDTFPVQLDAEGIYVYSCIIHPGMAGAIVVGDPTGPGSAEGSESADIAPPDAVDETVENLDDVVDELLPTSAGGVPGTALPIVGAVAVGAGYLLGKGRRRP